MDTLMTRNINYLVQNSRQFLAREKAIEIALLDMKSLLISVIMSVFFYSSGGGQNLVLNSSFDLLHEGLPEPESDGRQSAGYHEWRYVLR